MSKPSENTNKDIAEQIREQVNQRSNTNTTERQYSLFPNIDPDTPREREVLRKALRDLEELYQKTGEPTQQYIEQRGRLAHQQAQYLQYPFKQINRSGTPPQQRNITLGHTLDNHRHSSQPYQLQPDQLTRHLLSNGETGAGKTNLNYHLLSQLNQNNIPFLAFDLKQDYRHLLNTDQFQDNLIIIPWEKFAFNPLQPPEPLEKERRWMLKFVDVFGHSQHLLDASKSYLLQKLRDTWRKHQPPTLFDLQKEIRRENTDSYKRSNYRDTVLNRVQMLTFAGETVFQNQTGIPLPALLKNNVVIELDGLNARTQTLVIETLLVKIYLYRKHRNMRNQGLEHILLVDEAKKLFAEKKEADNPNELPTITEVISLLREFGEGIIAADQEPSKLAESLLSNTATKVMLPTTSYTQFTTIADNIGLKEEQRRWARNHLDTGVSLVYNRETGLAPVEIPLYTDCDGNKFEKTVTDTEVEQTITDPFNL